MPKPRTQPSQIPNLITLSRLALAPVVFVLFSFHGFTQNPGDLVILVAPLLLVLALTTDALDGWLARRLDSTTVFGSVLDPLVDKVVIMGTLVYFAAMEWSSGMVPTWAVVLMLSREFLITGIRGEAERRGISFGASVLGKVKTFTQSIAIVCIPFIHKFSINPNVGFALIMLATLATVYSGIDYVVRFARQLRTEGPSDAA